MLRQALGPSFIGLFVGTAVAILAAPPMRRFLYGVEPLDPVAVLLVPVARVCACILASLIPAHRALRIDPVVALRTE